MTTILLYIYLAAVLLCAVFLCYGIVHPERFDRVRRTKKPVEERPVESAPPLPIPPPIERALV